MCTLCAESHKEAETEVHVVNKNAVMKSGAVLEVIFKPPDQASPEA